MTDGFAFVAWPAVYKSSGIMTFIAGPDGDVYQKELGPETAGAAAKISSFDSDPTWSRVARRTSNQWFERSPNLAPFQ
jgi:hypothetical protein